ncbi:MAG: hypothetical protein J0H43_11715 [Actinobacteria bacterium]|nr:hypothetical protein [Actinomycetota bacterium]
MRALDGTPRSVDAAELERCYSESHRRYHGLAHVRAVLREADGLAADLGLGSADRALVALAACAHDVVYDARPGVDERASAEWVRERLTASDVPAPAVAEVARLVLTTLDHGAGPDDVRAAVLLDADLAILGADPDGYAAYVAGVRAEYAAVPDDAWRSGRAAVLTSLLDLDPLFRTAAARERWAAAARRNVAAELARLTG